MAQPTKKIIPKTEFKNRFQKFYQLNKERLNEERRNKYQEKKDTGVCTRCKRKALKGINFCRYHKDKQKEYNMKR